jgi:hypothetical protein
MMAIDLNNAERQREGGDIIPDGTVAPVILKLRELRPTKDKSGQMLDIEFTILAGPFAKRKFWGLMMVSGNGSEGHKKAVDITMSRIRGVLESAYGVLPSDDSEPAKAARRLKDWDDLDSLEFVARIGIEKGTGDYKDKNVLKGAVTPDDDDYRGFSPKKPKSTGSNGSAAAKPAGGSRPAWAS